MQILRPFPNPTYMRAFGTGSVFFFSGEKIIRKLMTLKPQNQQVRQSVLLISWTMSSNSSDNLNNDFKKEKKKEKKITANNSNSLPEGPSRELASRNDGCCRVQWRKQQLPTQQAHWWMSQQSERESPSPSSRG